MKALKARLRPVLAVVVFLIVYGPLLAWRALRWTWQVLLVSLVWKRIRRALSEVK